MKIFVLGLDSQPDGVGDVSMLGNTQQLVGSDNSPLCNICFLLVTL